MAWLDYAGRLRELPPGSVVIGSGPDAALRIEDSDLMPRHLVIEPRPDHVRLCAFSADVVIAANGSQIGTEPCEVPYGAPIRAGAGELRVWKERPDESETGTSEAPVAYLVRERDRTAFALDRSCTNIGRASANLVHLDDPTASRFHAQIRREAGGFALHVIGSTGGTVNGRRLSKPRLLEEGDVIELAYASFTFTRGPLAPDVSVTTGARTGDIEQADRPTVVRERERISHDDAGPAAPPGILRTAVVAGVLLVVVAAVIVALVR